MGRVVNCDPDRDQLQDNVWNQPTPHPTQTINLLGKKAREGTISIDEMAGGTFTISNGGVYGSMLSTPIINPPQVRTRRAATLWRADGAGAVLRHASAVIGRRHPHPGSCVAVPILT